MMRIQEIRFIRGSCCFKAFFVVLLIMVTMMCVDNKLQEQEEPLLAYLIDSEEISQDMIELLQTKCMHEFLHAKKTLQDLELKERSDGNEEYFSRTKMHEAITVLCPHVKKILLDCLRQENPSESWYSGWSLLSGQFPFSSTRRVLGQKNSKVEPTPFPTAAIIAVVAVLTIAVLIFLCLRSSTGVDVNDESPLLSLSLSDNSIASAQKLNSFGATAAEEKFGNLSFNSRLSNAQSTMSLYPDPNTLKNSEIDITLGNTDNPIGPLPPPPGIPPLKLPPGRMSSNLPSSNALGQTMTSKVGAQHVTSTAAAQPQSSKAVSLFSKAGVQSFFGKVTAQPPPPPSVPALPPDPEPPSDPAPPSDPKPPLDPEPPLPSPPQSVTAPQPPLSPIRPSGGPCPPPPPILPGAGSGPRALPPPPGGRGSAPPPPMRGGPPPPRGPLIPGIRPPRAPPGPHDCEGASKAKLKPFFWDKVTANSDDSMVWNHIRGGSFQFNEEMIESLFGCAPSTKNKSTTTQDPAASASPQFLQIIDARKSQNLSILLKALNVTTEEVHDALTQGNELPPELVQTLIKMAPTAEEELKLRVYNGDINRLGPAERFLKVMVEVPFAFKRLESLLFMCTLEDESTILKEAFVVLQAACTELRKNRLFLKLLEAVLKTGNRMNDGTFRGGAQAFKLDTLLKLSDVKGLDGKTTLLHFVVQEIIRSEGVRAARAAREMRSMSSFKSEDLACDITFDSDEDLRSIGLHVVSALANDLESVKKAAVLDVDGLTGTVAKLGQALLKARDFLDTDMTGGEEDGFCLALRAFVQDAEMEIKWLLDEEKRITLLMKSTADYFHGNAGKEEGLRLFVIVRDFLVILDKVCKEVRSVTRPMDFPPKKEVALPPPKNPAVPPPNPPKNSTTARPDPPKNSVSVPPPVPPKNLAPPPQVNSPNNPAVPPLNPPKNSMTTPPDPPKTPVSVPPPVPPKIPVSVPPPVPPKIPVLPPQVNSRQQIFTAIADRRMGGSSSSSEDD